MLSSLVSCLSISLRRRHSCHPIVGESLDCEPNKPKHRRSKTCLWMPLAFRPVYESSLWASVQFRLNVRDYNMSALSDVLPKNKELIAECESTTTTTTTTSASKEGETLRVHSCHSAQGLCLREGWTHEELKGCAGQRWQCRVCKVVVRMSPCHAFIAGVGSLRLSSVRLLFKLTPFALK